MNHKIISYSFVGIWENTILEIPLLEKKFCMDLFGDPYNTNYGMSPDGFIITYQGKINPSPTVIIGPQRIMVITQDLISTLDIVEKVKLELIRVSNNKFPFKLKACGINTEHEWTGLEINSSLWLSNRFIIKGLNVKKEHKNLQILTTDINFQLLLSSSQKMVLLIQPRANVLDGIFVSVNHHLDESFDEIPNKELLKKMFNNSIDKILTDIYYLVLN